MSDAILDNVAVVLASLVGVVLHLRFIFRCRRSRYAAVKLFSAIALAAVATTQACYVFSVPIGNGWYEAAVLVAAFALLVNGIANPPVSAPCSDCPGGPGG